MKTLIMIRDGQAKLYSVEDESWAKYQLHRRIEKEGWVAEQAFLVSEECVLPVESWVKEYDDAEWSRREKEQEREDLRTYERLKKRFEK